MSEEMLDISQSDREIKVTEGVRRILLITSGWIFVSSICGFIVSVIGLITSFFMLSDVFNRSYFREEEFIATLIFIAVAIMVFLVSKYLFDFRRHIKRGLRNNDDALLEKGFRGLRVAAILSSVIWVAATAFCVFIASMFIYFTAIYRY